MGRLYSSSETSTSVVAVCATVEVEVNVGGLASRELILDSCDEMDEESALVTLSKEITWDSTDPSWMTRDEV